MKLLIALALAAAPSALAMAPYVPDDEGPTAAPTLDPTPGPTPGPTPQPTPGPTPFVLPDPGSGYFPPTGTGALGEGVCGDDTPVNGIASIEFINTGSCFPFEEEAAADFYYFTYYGGRAIPNCEVVGCILRRYLIKKDIIHRAL